MKYRITLKDGSVHILEIFDMNTTPENEIKKWPFCSPSDVLEIQQVNNDDIPTDREFRNAWRVDSNTNKISINLNKAKEIQLLRLRAERNKKLDKYDKLLTRAQELEDEELVKEIKKKKQFLRDSTNQIKNLIPKSVKDIKDVTPDLSEF